MASENVNQILATLKAAVGSNTAVGGTIKFDFGNDGSVFIDAKSSPSSVSDGEGQAADCTLAMSAADYEKMTRGELNPMSAMVQGKMKITGNMSLMMKLGPVLQKAGVGPKT